MGKPRSPNPSASLSEHEDAFVRARGDVLNAVAVEVREREVEHSQSRSVEAGLFEGPVATAEQDAHRGAEPAADGEINPAVPVEIVDGDSLHEGDRVIVHEGEAAVAAPMENDDSAGSGGGRISRDRQVEAAVRIEVAERQGGRVVSNRGSREREESPPGRAEKDGQPVRQVV